MKGRALLRSAFKATLERADCWAGAKAEADARRAARTVYFIIVFQVKNRVAICFNMGKTWTRQLLPSWKVLLFSR
jgi:hypothetical protein